MTTTDLSQSLGSPAGWILPLMEFVDAFRRAPIADAIAEPVSTGDARLDALAAATAERLCDEIALEHPAWTASVAPLAEPWLVSGIESLRGLTIAESPAPFRLRHIFVLGNFLSRA